MSVPRIEAARLDDVPALAMLVEALFRLEPDFRSDRAGQARGLRRLIETGPDRARVAVARGPDGPVGLALAQLVVSTSEGGLSAWIEDVYVLPDWRGRGIGRALIDDVLAWATSVGATRAQLLADRGNAPALAFYRRLGWEATGLLPLRRRLGHGAVRDG